MPGAAAVEETETAEAAASIPKVAGEAPIAEDETEAVVT